MPVSSEAPREPEFGRSAHPETAPRKPWGPGVRPAALREPLSGRLPAFAAKAGGKAVLAPERQHSLFREGDRRPCLRDRPGYPFGECNWRRFRNPLPVRFVPRRLGERRVLPLSRAAAAGRSRVRRPGPPSWSGGTRPSRGKRKGLIGCWAAFALLRLRFGRCRRRCVPWR